MTARIGFSTGAMVVDHTPPLTERIAYARNLGCTAIELGHVRVERYRNEPLRDIDTALLSSFDWVSLHAPGGQWSYDNRPATERLFQDIADLHARHPLDVVIFHPDAVGDLSLLQGLPFPVGVENMDRAKRGFRTVDDFRPVFDRHPDWSFILDLQHCFSNDVRMDNVRAFVDAFGDRIVEIQVSGAGDVRERQGKPVAVRHVSLSIVHQDAINQQVSKFSQYPIIIESGCPTLDDVNREYSYVRALV